MTFSFQLSSCKGVRTRARYSLVLSRRAGPRNPENGLGLIGLIAQPLKRSVARWQLSISERPRQNGVRIASTLAPIKSFVLSQPEPLWQSEIL